MDEYFELVLSKEDLKLLLKLLSTPHEDPELEEYRKELFDLLHDLCFQPTWKAYLEGEEEGSQTCQERTIS
ncbi:MAG: hypothetical protein QXT58_01955 [Archaeoglobaceae archaeon]